MRASTGSEMPKGGCVPVPASGSKSALPDAAFPDLAALQSTVTVEGGKVLKVLHTLQDVHRRLEDKMQTKFEEAVRTASARVGEEAAWRHADIERLQERLSKLELEVQRGVRKLRRPQQSSDGPLQGVTSQEVTVEVGRVIKMLQGLQGSQRRLEDSLETKLEEAVKSASARVAEETAWRFADSEMLQERLSKLEVEVQQRVSVPLRPQQDGDAPVQGSPSLEVQQLKQLRGALGALEDLIKRQAEEVDTLRQKVKAAHATEEAARRSADIDTMQDRLSKLELGFSSQPHRREVTPLQDATSQDVQELRWTLQSLEQVVRRQVDEVGSLRRNVQATHLRFPQQAILASRLALQAADMSPQQRKVALEALLDKESSLQSEMATESGMLC